MISTTSSFPVVPTVPVLRGDAEDRETVVKMITAEGARAVLLSGEIGAGRTTLLTRGVVPLLQEGGALVLTPAPGAPLLDGLVAAALKATGEAAQDGEPARELLVRVINARHPTLAVFVLDDVDLLLGGDADGSVTDELHRLFVRVTTMTRGQARFLFSCADTRLHLLDALERRAGTLFPANVRLHLPRLPAAAARAALAAQATGTEPELLDKLIALVDGSAGVLPAELPILARAAADLGLRSARDLVRLGSSRPDLLWVERAAERAGERRAALRLLGELAAASRPLTAASAAAGADVAPELAGRVLDQLAASGVARKEGGGFALVHEILAARVRELAAPVRREREEARAVLAAASARGRLTGAEEQRVRAEGIVPARPEEARLLAGARARARAGVAVLCAIPVAAVVAYVLLQSGSAHLAVADDRLVVRSGRSFLPFGSVTADTGLSRTMVTPAAWRDLGAVEGDAAARAFALLRPRLRALRQYALSGDDASLEALRGELHGPDGWWLVLPELEPIARGTPSEARLLEEAIADPLTSGAAFAVVARTSARREGAFADLLGEKLIGEDAAARRQAAAIVARLSPASRGKVIAQAAAHPGSHAAEILAMLEGEGAPEAAATLLHDKDLPPAAVERAFGLAAAALARGDQGVPLALARLAGDPTTPAPVRERALGLLLDHLPAAQAEAQAQAPQPELTAAIRGAAQAGAASALPLYARLAPAEATALLGGLANPSVEVRVAMAQAYGVLAADPAAAAALDRLLDHGQPAAVRAAAARAYGRLGQVGQDRLSLIALSEGPPVGEAALYGLAESVLVGAGTGRPLDAIFKMWQRKGVAKRRAATAAALIAGKKPNQVADYMASAVYDRVDEALHPIGADGLCDAAAAGSQKAFNTLVTAAALTEAVTRGHIGACLASQPELAVRLAPRLAGNTDPVLRAAVAAALARAQGKDTAALLARLAADGDRRVRQAAVAALTARADKPVVALGDAWAAAGADERLALLAAAEAVGDAALVRAALADVDPEVRRGARRAGIALKVDVADAMEAALADPDPATRHEALGLIEAVPPAHVTRALEIASRDPDPEVAALAARRLGAQADPSSVEQRIGLLLADPSEAARARAVHLAAGLAAREPAAVITTLRPVLGDPSHEVRALATLALAEAMSARPAAELAAQLRAAERDAPRRLVLAGALLARAAHDRPAVQAALSSVRDAGPPFARATAALVLALAESGADGQGFLRLLVP